MKIYMEFLKAYHLLGYDLGKEEGVVLSLITSHISQFSLEQASSRLLWSRILEFTAIRKYMLGASLEMTFRGFEE